MKFIVMVLFVFCAWLNTSFASGWQNHLDVFTTRMNLSEKMDKDLNPFYIEGNKVPAPTMQDLAFKSKQNKINTEYLKRLEQEKKDDTILAQDKNRKGVDRYSDLSNKYITITSDTMNKIIDVWEDRNGYKTPFHGKGSVFIKASKKSGLDPLYIFAHAGVVS